MAKTKSTGGCGTFFILLAIIYAIAQFIEENYITIYIIAGVAILLILLHIIFKNKKETKIMLPSTTKEETIKSSDAQLDYANSLLKRARHLVDIINTTLDRQEFYISFDELNSVLNSLTELEGVVNFSGALPSENLKEINDNKEKAIDLLEKRIKEAETSPPSAPSTEFNSTSNDHSKIDPYFEAAGRFITTREKASIGMLQRNYKISFNRASRIMDQLYTAGVVGSELGTKPRKILMTEKEFIKAIETGQFDNINFENVPVYDFTQPSSSTERIKWYNNKFDYMTGNDFEQFCALVLQGNGYTTQVTPASGDFGVDIIAEQSGITYAIQCKCYSSDIGVDAVYQVAGGMKYYHANLGIVLTNRYFTRQAQELASGIGVVLWDRDSLIKLIHTSGLNDSFELTNIEEVTPEADELAAIEAYKSGDPDYQPSISQEDLIKELKVTK